MTDSDCFQLFLLPLHVVQKQAEESEASVFLSSSMWIYCKYTGIIDMYNYHVIILIIINIIGQNCLLLCD